MIKATPVDGVGGATMDRVKGELDRELGLLGAGPVAPDATVNDLEETDPDCGLRYWLID